MTYFDVAILYVEIGTGSRKYDQADEGMWICRLLKHTDSGQE
jgi:hypothetical protein